MKHLLSLSLIACTLFTSCGENQINQAVNIMSGLPALVMSFNLPPEVTKNIDDSLEEGKQAVIVFRDNPTRGNLRNAIAVFQGLIDRGRLHTGNPKADARFTAIADLVLFILSSISPPAELSARSDSGARVELNDYQKALVKEKLGQLELLVQPARQD